MESASQRRSRSSRTISALSREDPDAVDEARFVTLGLSDLGNLLVVVYMYRDPDIIRVISGWKANKRQRVVYEKGRS
jgi:uncharacterized protein